MTPSLHHQIMVKRKAAAELARQAQRPSCDPRTAHEMGVESARLARDAAELTAHLRANEQCMQEISHQIHYLAGSPHKSRHRSLVITALEDACARLHYENGEAHASAGPESHPL